MFSLHTLEIQRLTAPDDESGESYKRSFIETGEIVSGHLQTSSQEFTAMAEGEYGKTFQLFSDDIYADLREGDRLVEGDTTYDVKGVVKNTDGPVRKLEAVLTLHIEQ